MTKGLLLCAWLVFTFSSPLAARGGSCSPACPPFPIAYGEIYTVNTQTQSVGALPSAGLLSTFDSNGIALGTTPDFAANEIRVNQPGVYVVSFSVSHGSPIENFVTFAYQIRVNGATAPNLFCKGNAIEGAAPAFLDSHAGVMGLLTLKAGDVINVFVSTESLPTELRVEQANLTVFRIR